MHKVILHIGSNEGNRNDYLQSAVELIVNHIGVINKISSIYETEPWGYIEQNNFLNQAVEVSTILTPSQIIQKIIDIEWILGRIRTFKWGPRTIDIDIIFYEESIIDSENLIIPHPRMHERNFVLQPLVEIIPDWQHPILCRSVRDLYLLIQENKLLTETL